MYLYRPLIAGCMTTGRDLVAEKEEKRAREEELRAFPNFLDEVPPSASLRFDNLS